MDEIYNRKVHKYFETTKKGIKDKFRGNDRVSFSTMSLVQNLEFYFFNNIVDLLNIPHNLKN